MKKIALWLMVGMCIGMVSAVMAADAAAAPKEETFYTRPAIFSTRPTSQTTLVQSVDRFGPVGIGIELHTPAFTMRVKNVEEGSPAAAKGELKPGQIIESINGEKLHGIDPRIQLGNIITKAEATDGKVVFAIRDTEEDPVKKVTVEIPVLGAYSKTWPLECKKSDKIVRGLADHVAKQGDKFASQEMLFLLSTGEEQDLDVVRKWVEKAMANFKPKDYSSGSIYQWHVGWHDSSVAEYYLRTGDKSVFPYMQNQADGVRASMYHDGWGGRGRAGHHMGLAGTSTLRFILLARQCGIEVDEGMLQTALNHYSRYAGKGVNPYMDAHPEVTFTDNGRNGQLAFAMMAAAALLPDEKNDWYDNASAIAAMHSFYSASYMLHGHTGGGIGEVWRSAAMGLMYDKKSAQYRDFLDKRTWFYDLSRRYNGSFGIIGGTSGYDKEQWGITMGLTYTGPRKKLCIFGAPRSKYGKEYKIPVRPWGTAADDDFLKLEAAVDKDGKIKNLDKETIAEDSGLAFHRKMGAGDVSDEALIECAHHPQHMYRSYASDAIYKGKRFHLIPELLQSKDARVRYVGVTAMWEPRVSSRPERCDPGFPMDQMTAEVRDLLYGMMEDPKESWFVVDHILGLMSRRDAEELAPHMDRIIYFLGHEEPWLRHSALKTIIPLALDKRYYKKALAGIEANVPNFLRAPRGLKSLSAGLKDAEPEVQKACLVSLGRVYAAYPGTNSNPPGGRHPASDAWYLDSVAQAISAAPGGLDKLYEVSHERYPEEALAHRNNFLGAADLDAYGADLKKAIRKTILDDLIPEFVGLNRKELLSEAAWVKPRRASQFAVGKLGGSGMRGGLSDLYAKAGINDYNWHTFGPDRYEIKWDYYSFDPKEKQKWESSEARYRKVTLPAGMEKWSTADFDAKKAGWKSGYAPFASVDGEFISPPSSCSQTFCGCSAKPKTFWEKEVLLMRAKLDLPAMKEGFRYRLIIGGRSHVGSGDGLSIYFNGELVHEQDRGTGKRSGAQPCGFFIDKELAEKIGSGGEVDVAVEAFIGKHPRSKEKRGFITIHMEEMKIPPIGPEVVLKSAAVIPMVCSEWQDIQDPASILEPDEGKFRYDGKFKANIDVVGDWQCIGEVAKIDEFEAGKAVDPKFKPPYKTISIKDDGATDKPLWIYSGDMLMNLEKYEALRMVSKKFGGTEYLFVEAGGFSTRNPVGWKSPLVVLEKK